MFDLDLCLSAMVLWNDGHKNNALDSKAREIIRVKTSKGATLRPTRGLVEIHRTVKVPPVTRRPETTHLSNPMAASNAVS
jgi:hypothetical protein